MQLTVSVGTNTEFGDIPGLAEWRCGTFLDASVLELREFFSQLVEVAGSGQIHCSLIHDVQDGK